MAYSSVLDDSVKYLKGVGPKRAELFEKLGIKTVRDLLEHLPRSYMDFSSPTPIATAVFDCVNVVEVQVVSKRGPDRLRGGMTIYHVLVTDGSDDLTVVIFNSQYQFEALKIGERYILSGKVTGNFTHKEMTSPTMISSLSGDKILPIYPLTAGLTQNIVRTCQKSALDKLSQPEAEILPPDILSSYSLMKEADALRLVHFPSSREDIAPSRRRLALDELITLRLGMMILRSKNRCSTGFAMHECNLSEFYGSLPFRLTGAQNRAINECMSDMQKTQPMNRLILGDVGSGKTAVAAGAIYIATKNGVQSALMAPTEILASQHYDTLRAFLEPLGIKIVLLTGSLGKKKKTAVLEQIASGGCDVIVGTHAVIQKGVEYSHLGLVITDEQHRFGVEQRALLSNKGENPHRLVMSATPIPRTLALMIYGELDISVLDELPAGRKKIETYAVTGKLRPRACAFIRKQLDAGGQAYIVCPAIEESDSGIANVTDYAAEIAKTEFAGYRIGVLHGQLPDRKKEEVMRRFKDGEYEILISTTVVEVGVDVPNASVIMVENADRFGLSQLHQLRGRVGRGERESYCILITDNVTDESKKRLKVLSNTSNGFEISEADLEIRGPGNFFGSEQHGLPTLKMVDLAADSGLIDTAGKIAEDLWDRINGRECTLLRRRVNQLFENGEAEII